MDVKNLNIETARELVKSLFKDREGKPFILTDGQAEIFINILTKKYHRIHISAVTRYGKSETVSMAVLLRAATYPEKWAIIAGKKDKAMIIMDYVIGHIFDNPYTRARFIREKGETDETIKRYKRKDKINFKVGEGLLGELFIGSAKDAMGVGAGNVIQDESALIPDTEHALVMRMLGDQPDNFLVKIGNPFNSGHFRKSFKDPEYHKIIIDYHQGIREGRFTKEYIEEMKKQPFFDILYECKFPKEELADSDGWMKILTEEDLNRQIIKEIPYLVGEIKLGVDVGGSGRNFSVIVLKADNFAQIVYKNKDIDPIDFAAKVVEIWKEVNKMYERSDVSARVYGTKSEKARVFVDAMGVGAKTYGKLKEIIPNYVIGVLAGEKATDERMFFNKNAEMIWRMRDAILGGLKLVEHYDWQQILDLKYKIHLDRRVKVFPKEELLKSGIESPDVADALKITFASGVLPIVDESIYQPITKNEDLEIY